MPAYGARSLEMLRTCDLRLQMICEAVIDHFDHRVICGYRSPEEQYDLFLKGMTKIDGKRQKGKHNFQPSLAVDLLPYPAVLHGVNVWNDPFRFHLLAGRMMQAADGMGIRLRWGGDWNGDGSRADQTFHDLPHFELMD